MVRDTSPLFNVPIKGLTGDTPRVRAMYQIIIIIIIIIIIAYLLTNHNIIAKKQVCLYKLTNAHTAGKAIWNATTGRVSSVHKLLFCLHFLATAGVNTMCTLPRNRCSDGCSNRCADWLLQRCLL